MVHTFSDNNKIYSVDMMFAFLNIFKHKVSTVEISEYMKTFDYKGWGDVSQNIMYSVNDVLKNPTKKKYSEDVKRIKDANLKYPIIIYNNNIVDGVHRLTKSYVQNKTHINAYIFDDKLMKKFLINNKKDWNKVNNMKIHEFIELFYERFDKL